MWVAMRRLHGRSRIDIDWMGTPVSIFVIDTAQS